MVLVFVCFIIVCVLESMEGAENILGLRLRLSGQPTGKSR